METKERMTQLLLQVDEADEDDLCSEWMDLEPVLTIADLLLLLKAADLDGAPMFEPLMGLLMHSRGQETPNILSAAWMHETNLLKLAQQARLEGLGLLEKRESAERWELALTPKGAHAVDWWLGCLEDVGLKHDTLEPGAVRNARPYPPETPETPPPSP